jgi:hypothetical protein
MAEEDPIKRDVSPMDDEGRVPVARAVGEKTSFTPPSFVELQGRRRLGVA